MTIGESFRFMGHIAAEVHDALSAEDWFRGVGTAIDNGGPRIIVYTTGIPVSDCVPVVWAEGVPVFLSADRVEFPPRG